MSERSRTLLPAALTALVIVVVRQPRLVTELVMGPEDATLALVATFCVALGSLAFLRARLGARLPESVSLLFCALPFVVCVTLVELRELRQAPAWLTELSLGDHYERRSAAQLWATHHQLGALLSLALVISEVVTWARYASSSSRAWLGKAVLLALPFQLPWIIRTAGFRFNELSPDDPSAWLEWVEQPTELLVGAVACLVISLSLQRGGQRTLQILGGLSVASVLAFVITESELALLTLGYHGCGPATDLDHLEGHLRWLFGPAQAEGLFWLAGLVAFGLGAVVLKRRVPLLLPAIAVGVLGLHLHAVLQLEKLRDSLSPSSSEIFVPRGIGTTLPVMRISEAAVVDEYGTVLLRRPFEDLESLGKVLFDASEPPSRFNEWRLMRLSLDARLSIEQELDLGRVAKRHGLDALEIFEGELREDPGSDLLVSTHLRRLVATQRSMLVFLGSASPEARASETCRTLGVRGRSRHVVLELDGT